MGTTPQVFKLKSLVDITVRAHPQLIDVWHRHSLHMIYSTATQHNIDNPYNNKTLLLLINNYKQKQLWRL